MAKDDYKEYYVPAQSKWPMIGSIGLGVLAIGIVGILQSKSYGGYVFLIGSLIVAYMMFGWFSHVIEESLQGLYSQQMDRSFRWGMIWFIFSEVMFFGAFFGALFYARMLSVPWLGGEGHGASTHAVLWENFKIAWPLLENPDPSKFPNPLKTIGWELPAINTALLLSSGVTITWAHHGLLASKQKQLEKGLLLTVLLGVIFLLVQGYEYMHAYNDLGIKLNSGIYGSTFFMLTGFHGAHVTIGALMLFTIYLRSVKGHFTPKKHFAFEAAAWYWHFVDVVWIILFIFVYLV